MKICLGLLSILFLAQHGSAAGRVSGEEVVDSRLEAERLWEQAVAAKGGRKNLLVVNNLVETYGKKYKSVFVYAFPDRRWRWLDDRATPIGLSVDMVNAGLNLAYLVQPDKPPIKMSLEGDLYDLKEKQLYYLLVTRWVNPKPFKAEKGEMDGKAVDIVYVMVDDEKLSFALDCKTHLPVAITSYKWFDGYTFPKGQMIPAGEISLTDKFKDYREVSGVLMPHQVCFACYSGRNPRPLREQYTHLTFQINANLNEQIFNRVPTIEDGVGAWQMITTSQ